MGMFKYENGIVIVSDEQFLYVDNVGNFTNDLVSLQILPVTFPQNMLSRYYDQNTHTITYDDNTVVDDVVPWDHGDTIINAVDELFALWDARRPPRALGATKNDVWIRILGLRDSKKLGGVLISGNWYSSEQDMNVISKAALGAIILDNTSYKDLAGNTVTLTEQLAKNICAAISSRSKNCDDVAYTHKASIDALTTNEAVLAYDYTTGWPSSYGDV